MRCRTWVLRAHLLVGCRSHGSPRGMLCGPLNAKTSELFFLPKESSLLLIRDLPNLCKLKNQPSTRQLTKPYGLLPRLKERH